MDELVSQSNDLPMIGDPNRSSFVDSFELRERFPDDAEIPIRGVAQPPELEVIIDRAIVRLLSNREGCVEHIA
ncbi:MAG: hypothetical protein ABSH22_06340 [Tepidisphaeraceae bacterium]